MWASAKLSMQHTSLPVLSLIAAAAAAAGAVSCRSCERCLISTCGGCTTGHSLTTSSGTQVTASSECLLCGRCQTFNVTCAASNKVQRMGAIQLSTTRGREGPLRGAPPGLVASQPMMCHPCITRIAARCKHVCTHLCMLRTCGSDCPPWMCAVPACLLVCHVPLPVPARACLVAAGLACMSGAPGRGARTGPSGQQLTHW